jgi:nucleoside-diphosphate-sugar epimerase
VPQPSPEAGGPVEVHTGDLQQPETLAGFLADCNLLVHMASAHDHKGDQEMQRVNVAGTEALLNEARTTAGDGFQIWVVSSAVIGAPVYSYYRDSKRVQEKIIRGSGI